MVLGGHRPPAAFSPSRAGDHGGGGHRGGGGPGSRDGGGAGGCAGGGGGSRSRRVLLLLLLLLLLLPAGFASAGSGGGRAAHLARSQPSKTPNPRGTLHRSRGSLHPGGSVLFLPRRGSPQPPGGLRRQSVATFQDVSTFREVSAFQDVSAFEGCLNVPKCLSVRKEIAVPTFLRAERTVPAWFLLRPPTMEPGTDARRRGRGRWGGEATRTVSTALSMPCRLPMPSSGRRLMLGKGGG